MTRTPRPPAASPAPHELAAGSQPPDRAREFALGALRTCGVLAGFVVFGLGCAVALAPAQPSTAPYPGEVPTDAPATPRLWLIDGYNVVCANLLGGRDRAKWWSAEHRDALVERLRGFDDPGAALRVVFDGPEPANAEMEDDRVETVFAADADRWLLAELKAQPDAGAVAIVTGDRKVADRARHRGAQVFTPKQLLGRCTG